MSESSYKREDEYAVGESLSIDDGQGGTKTYTKTQAASGEGTADELDAIWVDADKVQYFPTLEFEDGQALPAFNKFSS